MDSKSFKDTQRIYSMGSNAGMWHEKQLKIDKDIGHRYVDVLIRAGIMPSTKEGLSDFVILSPSANQRLIETQFAVKLNQLSVDVEDDYKPKIVCSDGFGIEVNVETTVSEERKYVSSFIPGFSGALPTFDHVVIETISSEASRLPLPNRSVSLIWDRLGALWNYMNYAFWHNDSFQEEAQIILNEYQRLLKDNGKVIIDRGNVEVTPVDSTFERMKGVDFEKLGWDISLLGDGSTELAVLTRKVQ